MRSTIWLLLLLAAVLTVAVGCSDDSTTPADTQSNTGLLEGEIGDADFEITIGAAGDSRRHFEGPFVLRGSNLHYVDSLEALVVDLTITNRGEVTHAEPIGLTFVRLIPEGVTVENPDNGINGEGAAITFAFANDDGRWTPGEKSLPRTVQFGVGPGISIGFFARLDIGEPIDGGAIAGRVWNDANRDGVIDPDEGGIGGVRIVLRSITDEDTTVTDARRVTHSDRNGLYAFHRLAAGVYVVSRDPNDRLFPTTPTEITVLLTESNGDVSDFLHADFGCVPEHIPPDPFPIGAFAEVNGEYAADPDRVVAKGIELERCGPHPLSDSGDDDGTDDGADCRTGKLRGPVTAVDGASFAIMGTWVSSAAMNVTLEIKVGDRLDVRVHRVENAGLVADGIEEWNGESEEVHGRIEHVEIGDMGVIRLRVLDTLVIVMRHDPTTP